VGRLGASSARFQPSLLTVELHLSLEASRAGGTARATLPIGARRSFGSWLGMPKVASAQRPRPESSGSETQGAAERGRSTRSTKRFDRALDGNDGKPQSKRPRVEPSPAEPAAPVAQAKVHAEKPQPKRLKHYSAKEHAVRDASVQAVLKGELRACLCKQQTWYSSECALQRCLEGVA
jgi:hypothetical protein